MSGVLRGGAKEQPPSSSVMAAPDQGVALSLVMFMSPLVSVRVNRRRAGEVHNRAGANAIGRISNHPVVLGQTRGDLDNRTQVTFDRYRLYQHAGGCGH